MTARFLAFLCLLCCTAAAARAGGPWLDPNWAKRLPIAMASAPDSSMSGVVLLVDGATAGALFADAESDGSDLRVTSADGVSTLPHHLVRYDAGSSSMELWIRTDAIGPADTDFYIYYQNPAASSASDASATWSDFDAVYLFEATPGGTLPDASGHGNDAARVWGSWNSSYRVPGKIGSAWNYDDGRSMGVWGKQITQGAEWTVSAWARATTRSTDFILQGNPCYFSLHIQASNVSNDTGQYKNDYCPPLGWSVRTNTLLELDDWHHHTWSTNAVDSLITYDYDALRIPYNTQTDRNFPDVSEIPNIKWRAHPVGSTAEGVGIGSVMYPNNQDDMNGDVDHFTIRSFKVPAKMLAIEYANQNAPANFWVTGPVEDNGGSPVLPMSLGEFKSRYGGNDE